MPEVSEVGSPLHIAVDAHDLMRDGRGIGRYARALLSRYAQRDDVTLTLMVRDPFPFRFARAMRELIGAPRARVTNHVPREANVAWHPWNGTFFRTDIPAVVTVHDVVPFAFPAAREKLRHSQQEPFARTAATARAIVCDSQFTANEAARFLDVANTPVHVVPLGVDPVFSPGSHTALPAPLAGRRYILYVGAHDAHKNVATLAKAYRATHDATNCALVFTRPNPDVPEAIVCDGLDTAALVAVYRAATIVAVPSLYEGFGLPVLEAMACGAPVLASRAASLPEVGGEAVRYVDAPLDADGWAVALRELAASDVTRADMSRRGLLRATGFSWDRCADDTLAVLRGAARA
jgi:glycosyltransferase involved in cell wall biosynthesis